MHSKQGTGSIAVLAAATLWGTSGVAAALIPQVNPLTTGSVTLALGGLVLAAASGPSLLPILRAPGSRALLLGASMSLGGYILAFFSGMALAGVAIGAVIAIASSPGFVGLIELVVDGRRPSRRWLVATTITIAGGTLLVCGGGPDGHNGAEANLANLTIGIALALLAGLLYGVFTYLTAKLIVPTAARPDGLNERHAIAAVQGLAVLPMLIVAALTGLPAPSDASAWGALFYIAVVPTALGFILYARGLARISASSAALYTLFEPVVAALLAAFVLAEMLTITGWVGIVVVSTGLAVLSIAPRGDTKFPGATIRHA
jgi:DME family drug/metabolite transporter